MIHYKQTPKDVADDKRTIKEFTNAFMARFADRIQFNEFYQKNKFQNGKLDIGFGGQSILVCNPVSIDSPNYKSNREPMIWLTSHVWSCGIETVNGKTRFGRTYTIQFQLNGKFRPKFAKRWNDSTILKFYGYAENIEDILNEFEKFLDYEYKNFFDEKVKLNLEYV